MRTYEVAFEIEGPAAMFARPDTGSVPISYPVPTWSACKAMFESVARGFFAKDQTPAAFFAPMRVEIWRPVRYEKYTTNYRGPLRKSSQIEKEASYQLPATILVDVNYRVYGTCMRNPGKGDPTGNAPHALQDMFTRRLKQGASKYAPSLGWKEFLPSYFGPIREHSENVSAPRLQENLEIGLPNFLLSVWDAPSSGRYAPVFRECMVEKGALTFPAVAVEDGKLVFKGK